VRTTGNLEPNTGNSCHFHPSSLVSSGAILFTYNLRYHEQSKLDVNSLLSKLFSLLRPAELRRTLSKLSQALPKFHYTGNTMSDEDSQILMIPRPSAERGHFDRGWLKTFHTFTFTSYVSLHILFFDCSRTEYHA
jgi:hypothetical protein